MTGLKSGIFHTPFRTPFASRLIHICVDLQEIRTSDAHPQIPQEPCGRKDTVGKPILYATTDNFLKRFKLNSIDELPDYDELMAQIAELNSMAFSDDEDDSNYLYKKDEYNPEEDEENRQKKPAPEEEKKQPVTEDGYELPDFLEEDEDVIKIKDDN